MKTQVLNLESYDDRHSVLDKLKWSQSDRVIMIWPVRGTPLENKLDLKLIHRRCQRTDVKLAIVCKKRSILDFASELGIPVFRSLRQAQKLPWEYTLEPQPEVQTPTKKYNREELVELIEKSSPPVWMTNQKVRFAAFVISLVSVIVLAAFVIPGARIEYLPPVKTQSLTLELTASPQYQTFNLSGTIPAHYLTVTVEGRGETEATGQTGIPENPATGIIVFTNLTNQEVTIPRGTVVRTAGADSVVRFTTSTDASLGPEAGSTVNVPIEATNPGPQGNLSADSLVIIEGDLSRSLTATNPERTSGGNQRFSLAPAQEDYQELSEELLTSLWQTALEEAQSTLDEQDILLDSTPRSAAILEESFSPEEPQPSSTLSLILRVEYEILYLDWGELQAMGNAILDVTLPTGFNAQNESFQFTQISAPQIDDQDQVSWEVQLSRQIFTVNELPRTIKQILGRSPEKAGAILETELDLSAKPKISLFPEWWPIVPLLEVRIEAVDLHQDG